MRDATVSPLRDNKGYAEKLQSRDELPSVIPLIKSSGGTDIVVTRLSQLVQSDE